MSDTKNMRKKVQRKQDKLAPDQVQLEVDRTEDAEPFTPGNSDVQFPTEAYEKKSKKDELMSAKLSMQTAPGVTPFGTLKAKDADFKWMQKKQEAMEKANFEQWFAQWFDKQDPASKKLAREAYPSFYASRQRLLSKQTENLKKLASIKLHGIRTKDDLFTLYLAHSGRLDVGPLNNILNPNQNDIDNERAFMRGLLNPWRVFGKEPLVGREQAADDFATNEKPIGVQLGGTTGFPQPGFPNEFAGNAAWKDKMKPYIL